MGSAADVELSVVSYARLHGLSRDYLVEPPISHLEALQENVPGTLTDDTNLACFDLPIDIDTAEHLTVDKGAAKLLENSSSGLLSLRELELSILPLLDTRQTRKLRLETPLLTTDHASDFRYFARWEQSHFNDGCLPMEPLDDEMDTGLAWPQSLRTLPLDLLKELEGEKLELTKETMIRLQTSIKGSWTEWDEEKLWESLTSYTKNTSLCPVTPPLFPVSPPPTPYIPSSPACHLPLLSDPASLISEDLRLAEKAIFDDDTLILPQAQYGSSPNTSATLPTFTHVRPSDTCSPMDFLQNSDPDLDINRIKTEDRRVEVPLMPLMPVLTYPKTVTFKEVVEEMLLDPFHIGNDCGLSVGATEENLDKFFQDAFGDAANVVSRSIEQEQLQESDSKLRVRVPIMDFSLPAPPWEKAKQRRGRSSVATVPKPAAIDIQEGCGVPQIWLGVTKLEPKLRWTVFPLELAKVALEEVFGDENILGSFLEPPKDQVIMDSASLTWKRPGFRILKEDDDEDCDDLARGCFEIDQPQDIASLVKKRKMTYEAENSNLSDPVDLAQRRAKMDMLMNPVISEYRNIEDVMRGKSPKANNQKERTYQRNHTHHFDGRIFSAADDLDNFLEIRASKKQKPIGSAYFPGADTAMKPLVAVSRDTVKQGTLVEQPQTVLQFIPAPPINTPSTPTPYIISSTILKRRVLVRSVTALFPSAIPIDRDFTAHNTTAWLPNSISRSPVTSTLATEADIIVSPSTGIILTTLQKIKQKPLPGQKSKSAFKDRIERVSARYERLIVLISEGCSDESTDGLAELDTLALAEVIGFCSSLDTSIMVQFIAGGDQTLAKWLVAAMAQYGAQGIAIVPLLEEETLWELFLRRAGLNAYAAQAVIAELKAPEGVDGLGPSKAGLFGITAFVEMAQAERRRRFGDLLGGVRVLDRVGEVLDVDWA